MADESPQPPVDLVQLRAFTEGDIEFEKQCIGVFLNQSNENLRVLGETCIDGRSEVWVETAHMFKGGAASIGAVVLSKLCCDAQYLADATADQRKTFFQKIKDEYQKVTDYLKDTGSL